MKRIQLSNRRLVAALVAVLILTVAIAFLTPLEQKLGSKLRLIYLHGAWVWTGILTFCLAGSVGLAALYFRRHTLHGWSRSIGWSGLCFWITYLPMSLAVMQINWNGFFFDEPRWRVPFTFAIIGLLLQVGLWLINLPWAASLANFGFAVALMFNLSRMESVLHPESPVFTSGSAVIKWIFILLLASTLLLSGLLSYAWMRFFPYKEIHPLEGGEITC